jgi:hypothetical protein
MAGQTRVSTLRCSPWSWLGLVGRGSVPVTKLAAIKPEIGRARLVVTGCLVFEY